jgi:molybdate transport system substrate-binding protein
MDAMNMRSRTFSRIVVLIAASLTVPAVSFTQEKPQLRVLMSAGFSAAYRELLPEFERTTGIQVTTATGQSVGNNPNTIRAQLRRGVTADVVILSREGVTELIEDGRIVTGTDTDLAETKLGVAVRAGAARPDISTVEAFKRALLRAKAVAFTSSTSGVYLTTVLFPRLGIADEMAKKSTTDAVAAVVRGDAELAVQPVSELIPVSGVDYVGTIPGEIQKVNVYAAAVVYGSGQADAAKRLIAFLSSRAAVAAMKKNGMEPSRGQEFSGREKLRAHTDEFRKEVIEVIDGVHVAVGFSLGNAILIQGGGGSIIVDTTSNVADAREVKAEFARISRMSWFDTSSFRRTLQRIRISRSSMALSPGRSAPSTPTTSAGSTAMPRTSSHSRRAIAQRRFSSWPVVPRVS